MPSEHPPERDIQSNDGLHSHVVNRADQHLPQATRNGYPSRLDILYSNGHHPILRPISFTQRRRAEPGQSQDDLLDQPTDERHSSRSKTFPHRISNSGDHFYRVYSPPDAERAHIQQAHHQIQIRPGTTSASGFGFTIAMDSPMTESMALDLNDLQGFHRDPSTSFSYGGDGPANSANPAIILRPNTPTTAISQSYSSPTISNVSASNNNISPSRPPTPAQRQRVLFARLERLCIEALRWAWQKEIELRVQREVSVEKSWVQFCCGETAIPMPRTLPVPGRGRASSRWEPYPSVAWFGGREDGYNCGGGGGGEGRWGGRGGTRSRTRTGTGTGTSNDATMPGRQVIISPSLTEEVGIRGFVRLITDLVAMKHRASPSAFAYTPMFPPSQYIPHPPFTTTLSQNQDHPPRSASPYPIPPAGLTSPQIPQLDYIGARISHAVDAVRGGLVFLTAEEVRQALSLARDLCMLLGFQKGVQGFDDAGY